MENYAFISYSRDDQRYVERLAEWLQTAGVPLWLDHDIDYGETWTQRIESKLDGAGAVIVVMSPSARDSVWVSREIARAERKRKPTFPLLLSGDSLLQFETTQYVDVTDGSLPTPKFADGVAQSLGITLRGLGSDLTDVVKKYRESGVLILGSFTQERKPVLDALRNELRQRGFIPILFDFALPASLDAYETLQLFALAVRFIIADLTDPSILPHELASIVPFIRNTPVLSIRLQGAKGYSMFEDLRSYQWVLKTHEYKDEASLIAELPRVIAPATEMAEAIQNRFK